MNSPATTQSMAYAEYCAFEREATVKHEYLRGEVFAMAGGTLEHGRLAMHIGRLLGNALEGRPCRVFSSDVRVRVEATDFDTYPDLSIVCGAPKSAEADSHALVNPLLIAEVLSSSTEGYDRGQKASHYRRIPSLQAYLLVAQDEPRLELQIRSTDGRWLLIEARAGERLAIDPLGIELSVDELYRDALPR
ncbi:MAG: Uma2 family endonuclease [Enhygromyxa sp.]